jgi:hypothetical protein
MVATARQQNSLIIFINYMLEVLTKCQYRLYLVGV